LAKNSIATIQEISQKEKMNNCKLSWSLVFILLIIVALFAYKFTVGSVQPSEDGRKAVMLSKNERNVLLLEMRMWLQNTQTILAAASKNDFATVVSVATASGMAAEAGVPGSLFRKIPAEMKVLGFGTRKKFDEIAEIAKKTKDGNQIVAQVSETMKSCVACHATYRFVEVAP